MLPRRCGLWQDEALESWSAKEAQEHGADGSESSVRHPAARPHRAPASLRMHARRARAGFWWLCPRAMLPCLSAPCRLLTPRGACVRLLQSCLDLTIGMQALIHPDSFCDDIADASHDCSSGDDDTAVPLHWGRDLHSPERQGTNCRHVAVRPALKSPDACVHGTPRSQSAGGADGSENNTNSPCMADIFMALQAQGLREVPDDGASVGGEDAAGSGTHRSAASSKKASWGGSQVRLAKSSEKSVPLYS